MKNGPLVSVVIPTYNRIDTLPVSLDSVLGQTYENLEVIVIDDCSDDGTEEYLRGIGDVRVKYSRNSMNMGASAARNMGARLAQGEYLAFQDSDDEWMPDKLEKQMEQMTHDESLAMVYCEFGLYMENRLFKTIPSKTIPCENKAGDLFSRLLLFPLISTQTILVRRNEFLAEEGFNESLRAYEDYEFTLRFSGKHRIGFVGEALVKVNSSPGSVNKRYADRIHTQFFMVREMLEALRARDLLWKRLEIIMDEAESLICHDIFIDEFKRFMEESLADGERAQAGLLLRRIERDKEDFLRRYGLAIKMEKGSSGEEINREKWRIYKGLPPIKQKIAVLYQKAMENGTDCGDKCYEEAAGIMKVLDGCVALFGVPEGMAEKYDHIRDNIDGRRAEVSTLMVGLFGAVEELEVYIGERAKTCNVCHNNVFFLPMPASYEITRRRYGFPYWDARFQLESKENYSCPICGAYDRDRLMIAFLEEVRAEGSERLRMLQIAPSPTIERYALGRTDILYESTDLMMKGVTFQSDLQNMEAVGNETYDIIVCSHVLEHVENDLRAMEELHRILKPEGMCLVLVPLVVGKTDTEEQWGCEAEENWRRFGQGDHVRLYGREDFIRRLRRAGFCVNELGKEWFGQAFYEEHGFDDLSVLYVATKGIRLQEQ